MDERRIFDGQWNFLTEGFDVGSIALQLLPYQMTVKKPNTHRVKSVTEKVFKT